MGDGIPRPLGTSEGSERQSAWQIDHPSDHSHANADKRRVVMTLLEDAEWSQWSDNRIARPCAVDHKTVTRLRAEYLGNSQDSGARKVERGGTTYTQNTANIGESKLGRNSTATDFQEKTARGLRVPTTAPAAQTAIKRRFPPDETSAHMLHEAAAKDSYTLFIVDRLAVIDQTSAVFDEYGIPHGVVQGEHPRWAPYENVQVCSAQTLARRELPRIRWLCPSIA